MWLPSWWRTLLILSFVTCAAFEENSTYTYTDERHIATDEPVASWERGASLLHKIQSLTNRPRRTTEPPAWQYWKLFHFNCGRRFPLDVDFEFGPYKADDETSDIISRDKSDDKTSNTTDSRINRTKIIVNDIDTSVKIDRNDEERLFEIPLKFEVLQEKRTRRAAKSTKGENTGTVNKAKAPGATPKPKKKKKSGPVQAKIHTWGHFHLVTATLIIVWVCWFCIALGLCKSAASMSKKAALLNEN